VRGFGDLARQRAGDSPVTLARDNGRVARTKPAAVLVLRVWREGDGSNDLRARIVYTPEASYPVTRPVAGTVDDVCGAVRDWIVSQVAGPQPGDATVTAGRHPVDRMQRRNP